MTAFTHYNLWALWAVWMCLLGVVGYDLSQAEDRLDRLISGGVGVLIAWTVVILWMAARS